MATNDTFTNTNLSTTNQHRSVFLCPERLNPNADLNSITFSWILVAIIFITCPFTVLFNSLVIVALKKRRELEKRSNILLCSMAVTDLLTGALTMPLSATYELLIIKPGSISGHLSNTTLGKQTNDLFTVHIIVIPLNCHCVGEENGCKKLDKIQEQCYRKSSYGTCDSCLAVWSYHTGSTNSNGGGWCTPQIYFHLARGKNCFDDWLLSRHWLFLFHDFPGSAET